MYNACLQVTKQTTLVSVKFDLNHVQITITSSVGKFLLFDCKSFDRSKYLSLHARVLAACHDSIMSINARPPFCSYICLLLLLLLLRNHFSHVRLYATPQTAAHQAPLSLGFSRQEHWSGLPFPSPMHEREK